jgi:Ras GTPase-activating-like protein IQGAP2/3
MDLLSNPTGASAIPRRWVPSHRVANSVDAIRGKWEERAKEDETRDSSVSPTKEGSRARTPTTGTVHSAGISAINRSSTPPFQLTESKDEYRTPTYLKRRTLPAPIIASPLSPNSTGITIEDDSRSLSAVTNRIHLPSLTRIPSILAKKHNVDHTTSDSTPSANSALGRKQRSNTLDNASARDFPRYTSANDAVSNIFQTQSESKNRSDAALGKEHVSPVRRRPTSLYGANSVSAHRPISSPDKVLTPSAEQVSPASTVNPMFPRPYRSSYMSTKKSGIYGENLSNGRRLGRHLPRIASGDGEESQSANSGANDNATATGGQQSHTGAGSLPASPHKQDIPAPPADDVAGLPGRVQLKAPSAPASPSPSYKLYGALCADTQRHLIQAYEYLCHVGEAQQWIEGCIGEELGFGVVEMEEGLRNGVVLAKLVRAFKGDSAVRKIYDVSHLRLSHHVF